MKLLLVGPYPPPHGGVSVHVYEAARQLRQAGVECRILNVDRRAPESAAYIRIGGPGQLLVRMIQHARRGWTLHVHTNGHNRPSWIVALIGALAGRFAPSCLLTLHSGMAPDHLRASRLNRLLARSTCSLYRRVVAVSPAVRDALVEAGVAPSRIEVEPAFLFAPPAPADWAAVRRRLAPGADPLLVTALFFRPEYGFDVLVDALSILRRRHPAAACLVLGSGEQQAAAEDLLRKKHLQHAIILAGNMDHDQALGLISQADVFVRPTLTDGDAISVREALALGVPVAASNVGTRPEGVVLFEAGNAAALAGAVETALARRRAGHPGASAAGSIDRLLHIYRQAGPARPLNVRNAEWRS
jgi:glycogen synthase